MRLMNRRAKSAARTGKARSYVEIDRILRRAPNRWEATVEYTYGRATWVETVSFMRTFTPNERVLVVVTDVDYPDDRSRRCLIPARMDMPSFITTFLISGRW